MFQSFEELDDTPPDIVRFENMWLLGLALATVNVILLFESMTGQFTVRATAAIDIGIIGISALLMVYTTRRRSNFARWMLAIPWNVLVVAYYLINLPLILDEKMIATLVIARLILIVVATHKLFTPASRAWFAGRELPLPSDEDDER